MSTFYVPDPILSYIHIKSLIDFLQKNLREVGATFISISQKRKRSYWESYLSKDMLLVSS